MKKNIVAKSLVQLTLQNICYRKKRQTNERGRSERERGKKLKIYEFKVKYMILR